MLIYSIVNQTTALGEISDKRNMFMGNIILSLQPLYMTTNN